MTDSDRIALPCSKLSRIRNFAFMLMWLAMGSICIVVMLNSAARLLPLIGITGAIIGIGWHLLHHRRLKSPFCQLTTTHLLIPQSIGNPVRIPWNAVRSYAPNRAVLPDVLLIDWLDESDQRRTHPLFFRECAEPIRLLKLLGEHSTYAVFDRRYGDLLTALGDAPLKPADPWSEIDRMRRW